MSEEKMTKADAFSILKCKNDVELADALGITKQAVGKWPDPLPDSAVRRVHAKAYAMRGNRVARR